MQFRTSILRYISTVLTQTALLANNSTDRLKHEKGLAVGPTSTLAALDATGCLSLYAEQICDAIATAAPKTPVCAALQAPEFVE